MKKIAYLILILTLVVSGSLSVSADVSPMVISHPCHLGESHDYCDLDCVITRSCGCKYEQYECCCGYNMPIVYVKLCYIHQFANAPSKSDTGVDGTSDFQQVEIPVSISPSISAVSSSEAKHIDEDVSPMVISHPCHLGLNHQRCEWWNFDYTCGCEATNYECCCGAHMGDETTYCSEHSWSNPPYDN
jgi:hypothetical protein